MRQGQPVADAPPIRQGDHLTCKLRDGTSVQFAVTEVDATTIKGRNQNVQKSDVAKVEIRQISGTKVVLTVLTLTALGFAVAAVGQAAVASAALPGGH